MSAQSEYVYLPEWDGEWSVMARGEYDSTGGEGAYGPAEPAELVFNLEGWRGHYLAADFVLEAVDLVADKTSPLEAETAADAVQLAVQYRAHNELSSPASCPEGCDCEFIGEVASSVEEILATHGYVVEWDDGVAVFARIQVEGDCVHCGDYITRNPGETWWLGADGTHGNRHNHLPGS